MFPAYHTGPSIPTRRVRLHHPPRRHRQQHQRKPNCNSLLPPPLIDPTQIYATSQEFEIKALGSAYPTTTVVAGSSTSGTGTATGASSTATKSSAEQLVMSIGTAFAAAGAVLGLIVG